MAEIDQVNENMNSIEELTASRTAIIEISKISDPYMVVLSATHDAGIDVEFRDYMKTCMVGFLNNHKDIRSALKNQTIKNIRKNIWCYLNTENINKVILNMQDIRRSINNYFNEEKLDRDSQNVYDNMIAVFNNCFCDERLEQKNKLIILGMHIRELLCDFSYDIKGVCDDEITFYIRNLNNKHIDVVIVKKLVYTDIIDENWRNYIGEYMPYKYNNNILRLI